MTTKKCTLSQTEVLNDNGSVVALALAVSENLEKWEQMREQLESPPAPLINNLLVQTQPWP